MPGLTLGGGGGAGTGAYGTGAGGYAQFGVAFGGATGCSSTWAFWTPGSGDVTAAKNAGATQISIPLWIDYSSLSAWSTYAEQVKVGGLALHAVPHFDGLGNDGSGTPYRLYPYTAPTKYCEIVRPFIAAAAAVMTSGDTFELWNEAAYNGSDGLGYPDVARLYSAVAIPLAEYAREQFASGVKIVLPFPGNQSPESAALVGTSIAASLFQQTLKAGSDLFDIVGGHFYPYVDNRSAPRLGDLTQTVGRVQTLVSAANRAGLPLMMTECGVLEKSTGYANFIRDLARSLTDANLPPMWWNWKAPSGYYDVVDDATVLAAILTPPLLSS